MFTLDPAWFFLGVLDWGAAIPALLCRCLAFYFLSVWWQNRNAGCLLVAGLFLGLGVFNKIDLFVVLAATGTAALCFYAKDLWQALRSRMVVDDSCVLRLSSAGRDHFAATGQSVIRSRTNPVARRRAQRKTPHVTGAL